MATESALATPALVKQIGKRLDEVDKGVQDLQNDLDRVKNNLSVARQELGELADRINQNGHA